MRRSHEVATGTGTVRCTWESERASCSGMAAARSGPPSVARVLGPFRVADPSRPFDPDTARGEGPQDGRAPHDPGRPPPAELRKGGAGARPMRPEPLRREVAEHVGDGWSRDSK